MSPAGLYHLETAWEQDDSLLQGLIPETRFFPDSMDEKLKKKSALPRALNVCCILTQAAVFLLCVFGSLGSTATVHSSDQHVCQRLPHDATGQRHLDTICYLDGGWWVVSSYIIMNGLVQGFTSL